MVVPIRGSRLGTLPWFNPLSFLAMVQGGEAGARPATVHLAGPSHDSECFEGSSRPLPKNSPRGICTALLKGCGEPAALSDNFLKGSEVYRQQACVFCPAGIPALSLRCLCNWVCEKTHTLYESTGHT